MDAHAESKLREYFTKSNLDVTQLPQIFDDGRIHRCPRADETQKSKTSGWYQVHNNPDGTIVAVAGYYRGSENFQSPTFVYNLNQQKNFKVNRLSPEEVAAREREIALNKEKHRLQRVAEQELTGKRAAAFIKFCEPITPINKPQYLIEKGIEANGALYNPKQNSLVIPYYHLSEENKPVLSQLQNIYQNQNEEGKYEFNKRFIKGGMHPNAYHPMGDKRNEDKLILVSESFSTGASVAQATGAYVLAATSATTIPALTAQVLERSPPYFTIGTAVDADAAGINAAAKTKQLTTGLSFAPDFESIQPLIPAWKEAQREKFPDKEPHEPSTWGHYLELVGAKKAFEELNQHPGPVAVAPDFSGYGLEVAKWMNERGYTKQPTDFNDLMQIAGPYSVQSQIQKIVDPLIEDKRNDFKLNAFVDYERRFNMENRELEKQIQNTPQASMNNEI